MVFAVIVIVAVISAISYIGFAALRSAGARPTTPPAYAEATRVVPNSPSQPSAIPTGRPPERIMFQNVARDAGYAHIAVLPTDDVAGQRSVSGLSCERVHFGGGRGLCLVPDHGLITTYRAAIFDSDFQIRHEIPLAGAPTRARVSSDGRYAAATVFVFGHSYADANFSTQTLIIDMAAGTSLGDLETYTTTNNGTVLRSEDFNFWGVTFSSDDSSTFYATLRTGGRTHLVKGNVNARTMELLHENVECPSLSPDGTRVAFKKLTEGLIGQWRLHVLDLGTMSETVLAETRNIDDQVEWLNDSTIVYGDGQSIWSAPADGSGQPSILIADGLSPAVIR